ncbi:MAG: amidohydrolase [Pirellulaceae bacterium]
MNIRSTLVMGLILAVGFTASVCNENGCQAQGPATGTSNEWIESNLTRLIEDYVHLHKNPELSFYEEKTAAYVSQQLTDAGFDVTENIGGFGLVGVMENGNGPTVLVRTDLDGLPVVEETQLPYASQVKVKDADGIEVGTMHACGHDIHMTCLIGAARYLNEHRDEWSGRLLFLGQPAEERGSGAKAMIDDGLFDRFGKPDYALALHCSANLPTGVVALRGGYAMANVDSVDIEIFGRGGHGAYPHTTIDPVVVAARLIVDIQSIVSREINPTQPAVITVGSIHAGTKHNIISDKCHLQLTVRSYADDVREHLLSAIQRKAKAAADSAGAPAPEITISEGTPSLANDEELTARIRSVFETTLGAEHVSTPDMEMGGEDFSLFGRNGIPSLMFRLGTIEPRKLAQWKADGITPPSLHSSKYAPEPQRAIETGVTAMSAAIIDLLKNR